MGNTAGKLIASVGKIFGHPLLNKKNGVAVRTGTTISFEYKLPRTKLPKDIRSGDTLQADLWKYTTRTWMYMGADSDGNDEIDYMDVLEKQPCAVHTEPLDWEHFEYDEEGAQPVLVFRSVLEVGLWCDPTGVVLCSANEDRVLSSGKSELYKITYRYKLKIKVLRGESRVLAKKKCEIRIPK